MQTQHDPYYVNYIKSKPTFKSSPISGDTSVYKLSCCSCVANSFGFFLYRRNAFQTLRYIRPNMRWEVGPISTQIMVQVCIRSPLRIRSGHIDLLAHGFSEVLHYHLIGTWYLYPYDLIFTSTSLPTFKCREACGGGCQIVGVQVTRLHLIILLK